MGNPRIKVKTKPAVRPPYKVVFVESVSKMGGVEFTTLYLAQKLDRDRWKPLVICPEEGDLVRACYSEGIPVIVIPRPKLFSTSISISAIDVLRFPNLLAWIWNAQVILIAALRLTNYFHTIRPHLIVTKGMFSHLYGGLAAFLSGTPCIWHLQDFISERFCGIYRKIFGVFARFLPKHIIVDGGPIKRQLPLFLHHKIDIVYNGVDTTMFKPGIDGKKIRDELGIAPCAIVIGNVARITPWKGQHYLLEAFAKIASSSSDVYLLLVGAPVFDSRAYESYLHKQVSNFGLNDKVIFTGYRYDLPFVFSAMDIFAYTAVEKDTNPLSLLSAMASGLPTVAFDLAGVREVIEGEGTGILVPLRNTELFAGALFDLICNSEKRRKLSHSAKQRIENTFSLEKHIFTMESIFSKAV